MFLACGRCHLVNFFPSDTRRLLVSERVDAVISGSDSGSGSDLGSGNKLCCCLWCWLIVVVVAVIVKNHPSSSTCG